MLNRKITLSQVALPFLIVAVFIGIHSLNARAAQEAGSVGIEGTISAPPPTTGATISLPINGSTVTSIPVTVSGICPNGLLVKLFKNGVFSGSVQCEGGSFSLQADLFTGTNELIARVYDDLDQTGPDSNTVNITFQDNSANATLANRPTLTSNFAKRGANPGQTLSWPIVLSGGVGPYAVNVEWGDGKTDLLSIANPQEFILEHKYETAGIYKVIVKAVDSRDAAAFLQLTAIANGPLSQTTSTANDSEDTGGSGQTRTVTIWWPAALLIPFIITTFWLGKRYEKRRIVRNLIDGKRPF
jgi:hypothetical protein